MEAADIFGLVANTVVGMLGVMCGEMCSYVGLL